MDPGCILSKIHLWAEKAFSESDKLALKHILFSEIPISPYDLKEIFLTKYNKSYNILHRSFNKLDDYNMVDVTTVSSDKGGLKKIYQLNFFGFCLSMTILFSDFNKSDNKDYLSLISRFSNKDLLLSFLISDYKLETRDERLQGEFIKNIVNFLSYCVYNISDTGEFDPELFDIFEPGWVPPKNIDQNDRNIPYNDFFYELINTPYLFFLNENDISDFAKLISKKNSLNVSFSKAKKQSAIYNFRSREILLRFTTKEDREEVERIAKNGNDY